MDPKRIDGQTQDPARFVFTVEPFSLFSTVQCLFFLGAAYPLFPYIGGALYFFVRFSTFTSSINSTGIFSRFFGTPKLKAACACVRVGGRRHLLRAWVLFIGAVFDWATTLWKQLENSEHARDVVLRRFDFLPTTSYFRYVTATVWDSESVLPYHSYCKPR